MENSTGGVTWRIHNGCRYMPRLWGPFFEGVVSVVSGLRSGVNLLRIVQHKKTHEKSFWWHVTRSPSRCRTPP